MSTFDSAKIRSNEMQELDFRQKAEKHCEQFIQKKCVVRNGNQRLNKISVKSCIIEVCMWHNALTLCRLTTVCCNRIIYTPLFFCFYVRKLLSWINNHTDKIRINNSIERVEVIFDLLNLLAGYLHYGVLACIECQVYQ